MCPPSAKGPHGGGPWPWPGGRGHHGLRGGGKAAAVGGLGGGGAQRRERGGDGGRERHARRATLGSVL